MNNLEKIDKLQKELDILRKLVLDEGECITKYPIYCRNKLNKQVVKFTSLNKGTCIFDSKTCDEIEKTYTDYIPHTDTSIWKEIAYDEERRLHDKQVVWCWNEDNTQGRAIRFYDAINKCVFHPKSGFRGNGGWDNYEAVEQNQIPQFMLDTYENLED